MLVTSGMMKRKYKAYSNKNTKLSRDVKTGKLIKIKNGLYETDAKTSPYLLAGSIYGPSYISFEYALSCYGLIPERVYAVTCATFGKKKKKMFNTPFGLFLYRDVPKEAYQYEVLLKCEKNYSYQIATPEKALCDKLYTLSPLKNYKELENMLFDDLRIDVFEFENLRADVIEALSTYYHSTNIKLLAGYMKKRKEKLI